MLSMRIPPFIRIDLFQIILTQALSLGNISQNVIKFLPFSLYFSSLESFSLLMFLMCNPMYAPKN